MANFNINEIKEQFKTAIRVSQGIENPQVDELFELWLNAKRDFIEVMGGNLIYQYPEKVSFTLEESQKKRAMGVYTMWDASTPMNTWNNVELWDEQMEGCTPDKVGRVRSVEIMLFHTREKLPYEIRSPSLRYGRKDARIRSDRARCRFRRRRHDHRCC